MIHTERKYDGTTRIVCEISGREWVADAIHRKETIELVENWQRDILAKLEYDPKKPVPLQVLQGRYQAFAAKRGH